MYKLALLDILTLTGQFIIYYISTVENMSLHSRQMEIVLMGSLNFEFLDLSPSEKESPPLSKG